MNITIKKKELIKWISQIRDTNKLKAILDLKKNQTAKKKKRTIGCGKNIFIFVASDFDAPVPEFQDYTK